MIWGKAAVSGRVCRPTAAGLREQNSPGCRWVFRRLAPFDFRLGAADYSHENQVRAPVAVPRTVAPNMDREITLRSYTLTQRGAWHSSTVIDHRRLRSQPA